MADALSVIPTAVWNLSTSLYEKRKNAAQNFQFQKLVSLQWKMPDEFLLNKAAAVDVRAVEGDDDGDGFGGGCETKIEEDEGDGWGERSAAGVRREERRGSESGERSAAEVRAGRGASAGVRGEERSAAGVRAERRGRRRGSE
ncbi:hypothetical protein Scep_023517 [Stephania cephalantha]|uniref:Uncharacterized protein n=1 Tax=Stephania cephalantha TaxID=152367 RepID=A0AAP0EXR7_9MAGN